MANFVLVALAAQESDYTPDHIRLLMRKGLVKGQKVGGTWLVDQDDLKRYEAQMKSLGNQKFDPTRNDENLT
jgi:hypothetical protein